MLEFDFVPSFSTVQFSYVFSSEEYSDFANTEFNDVFGFFVNGNNCALVPGTNDPVDVNSINDGNDAGGDTTPHNPQFFVNNVPPTLNTQMDGLTTVLTCSADVFLGVTNHMKLAIVDGSDATSTPPSSSKDRAWSAEPESRRRSRVAASPARPFRSPQTPQSRTRPPSRVPTRRRPRVRRLQGVLRRQLYEPGQ